MFNFFKRVKPSIKSTSPVSADASRSGSEEPSHEGKKIVKRVRFKFASENNKNKPTSLSYEDQESRADSVGARSDQNNVSLASSRCADRRQDGETKIPGFHGRLDNSANSGQLANAYRTVEYEDDDGLDSGSDQYAVVPDKKPLFSFLDMMGGKGRNRHKNKHHHQNVGQNKKFKNDILPQYTTTNQVPSRSNSLDTAKCDSNDDFNDRHGEMKNVRATAEQIIETTSRGREDDGRDDGATRVSAVPSPPPSNATIENENRTHFSPEEIEPITTHQTVKQSTENDAPLQLLDDSDQDSSEAKSAAAAANFVRDLVLQKYKTKNKTGSPSPVNLVGDQNDLLTDNEDGDEEDSFPTVIWDDIERQQQQRRQRSSTTSNTTSGAEEVGPDLKLATKMGQPQSKGGPSVQGQPPIGHHHQHHQSQHQDDQDVFYEAEDKHDTQPSISGNLATVQPDVFSKLDSSDDTLTAFKFSGSLSGFVVDENNNNKNDDSGCDDVVRRQPMTMMMINGGQKKGAPHVTKSTKVDESVSLPDVVGSIGLLLSSNGTGNDCSPSPREISSDTECSDDQVTGMNGHWTENHNSGYDDDDEELDSDRFGCDKRDLVNQESRFTEQLTAAEKQNTFAQGKVTDLQIKLDKLERDLTVKIWTIDRLEAELVAANKEGECVRRKLKLQEEEMSKIKSRYDDTEDLLNRRYQDLEDKYNETHQKLLDIQAFTSHLQVQLAEAQSEAETNRLEAEKLQNERKEEEKIIQDALDRAIEDRSQVEAKWHKEFENLRNLNQDREEHLMEDCEWKMRNMQKQCKEKLEKADLLKKEAIQKMEEIELSSQQQIKEIQSLKSYELEVKALRGLTADQRDNIVHIMKQLDDVKAELIDANQRAEEEIRNAKKIKFQCQNELIDKERYMQIKIEESKMHISIQWERKLLEEMIRLKCELESVHADERKEALDKLKEEYTVEINELVKAHNSIENSLKEEIAALKQIVSIKKQELMEANEKADKQIVDTRIYIDRSDRSNQLILDREVRYREELLEQIEADRQRERDEMEEQFLERLQSVKDEFARELVDATQELEAKHKRMLGTIPVPQKPLPANPKSMRRRGLLTQQRIPLNLENISETQLEQFVAEKEEMLQTTESRHRIKVQDLESRLRELAIEHQRDIADLERNYGIERSALEQRDTQNSQEIDTLHRKCRCLTKLFEEMRMRYERREPRQEDLREIAELKERCESQERDLYKLTESLRNIQIAQVQLQPPPPPRLKNRKPNPIINCDVIYEEQEEECDSGVTIIEMADDEDDDSTCMDLVPVNDVVAIVESP